jgi:hypothetical protein
MLFRIALAIAILAGIGATVLNFLQMKEKVTTIMATRDQYLQERDKNAADRDTAQKLAKQTQATLDQTKKQLTDTKSERDTAVTEAERQKKEATRLSAELKKTSDERTAAQQELSAWKALGLTVDQIHEVVAGNTRMKKELSSAENTRLNLEKELNDAKTKLLKLIDPDYDVPEPNVTAKVIVVDPKFDFIVLDVGQDRGMLEGGDMLVNRDGKLVAKVRIRSVERDRCVANVLPGWKLTSIIEGDIAVAKVPKL